MQPNIDMGAVREAIARRAAGGFAGGTGQPAAQQISAPAGGSPLQAPPTRISPTGPLQTMQAAPQQPAQAAQGPQGAPGGQQGGQGQPQFDGGTRELSKALIQRLLKVI